MRKLKIDLDELVDQATWNDELEVGPLRYFDRDTGNIVFVDRALAQTLHDGKISATTKTVWSWKLLV